MKGKRKGLKTCILKDNPKAIYVHCYGHSLQLAVQDATKASKIIQDSLDLCSEVANLIRKSSKRTAVLATLKEAIKEPTVGIRSLCPTRYLNNLFIGLSV